MKLCFSTENVNMPSFLQLCRFAADCALAGFEIFDPVAERRAHSDSVTVPGGRSDAMRKLRNRGLEVPALRLPQPLEELSEEELLRAVDLQISSGIRALILCCGADADSAAVCAKLKRALRRAEEADCVLLIETVGAYADTSKLLELFSMAASVSLFASWNVRATFFDAGESAETTIKTLGAYVRYVRLGDRLDGKNVLIGEGKLPVGLFVDALRSLDYDGYICADNNDEFTDPDLVMTHFVNYMTSFEKDERRLSSLPTNRDGSGTFPFKKYTTLDLTFPQLLDHMASLYPDRYAFKYTTLDYTRTYAQFRRDVDRAAAAFIRMGVKPGYHVAIWAPNIPQWFITFWAATRIGAVLVTVNTAYKIHEIEYLLRQSDTHTLVMSRGNKDTDYKEIIEELCPELKGHKKGSALYAAKLPFLRHVVPVGFPMEGCLEWYEMLEEGEGVPFDEVRRRASEVKCDDVCNMQYTSGTTGFPKGVMLTHRNIINNGKIIGDRMDLSTADRMMIQVPMFHCFGMVLSMTSMMTHGGTLCPLPYFSPKSSLACVTQEKITCFNGVPTMFIAMFNHEDFPKTDFSHMRTGIMAGSNCPPELMKRASVEMNMREILSVYGQTEAAPGCTMGEVNESLELRTETVGSAFPGVECKIIDPETGKDLPDGQSGEFVARGFNIMKGYYKMPEATAQTVDRDGWLHSGDICCRTPEGYYRVTGRLKDMIIRGGENLYPREIEEFYLTHPKVKDVQVIGVPDKTYGEEACTWIILHEGETADAAEMTAFGRAHIARHKVPRYFLFVSELPMNAAGKILKYKMKEESVRILGL